MRCQHLNWPRALLIHTGLFRDTSLCLAHTQAVHCSTCTVPLAPAATGRSWEAPQHYSVSPSSEMPHSMRNGHRDPGGSRKHIAELHSALALWPAVPARPHSSTGTKLQEQPDLTPPAGLSRRGWQWQESSSACPKSWCSRAGLLGRDSFPLHPCTWELPLQPQKRPQRKDMRQKGTLIGLNA